MPAIYASLRSADFDDIEGELHRLAEAGVDGLHLDVMDGRFCDEVSLPIRQVRELRPMTGLPFDVHLMVEEPGSVLQEWIELEVQRIAFHLEACPEPVELIDRMRASGVVPGLVILPSTPTSSLDPWLDRVEFVNLLGVNPVEKTGFEEATFERIRRLKDQGVRVQADGGVWEKTRNGLVAAGADELVGGHPIFSKKDYSEAVAVLRHGSGP